MVHVSRALMGVIAAGLLALPALQSAAAPKKKPAKPAPKPAAGKPDAKLGKSLYMKEGCSSCHKAGDIKGGDMGPALPKPDGLKTAAQITDKILHPGPSSIMPALKDPKKAAHIAAFLVTLK